MPSPPKDGVDWKLAFHQLFAAEIRKEHLTAGLASQPGALDRLLAAYTHYTPLHFNEVVDRVCAAPSSAEAYRAREAIYNSADQRSAIAELDVDCLVSAALRREPAVRSFLDRIDSCRDRVISADESFFESTEGQATAEAFRVDGDRDEQEVALVVVPGYAAHTIKYQIFDEIIADANRFHGRPAARPLLREDGIDLEFEPHTTFYDRTSRHGSLDVLHPLGGELGNSTGPNRETTDAIAHWIETLPARYQRKRLIFVGYSKGAPIALELLHRYPALSKRVAGFITYGGVLQGTHVARLAIEQVESVVRVPMSEFIETLRREDPNHLGRVLSPLFQHIDLSWLSLPRIRRVFEIMGYDIAPLQRQVDRLLGGQEVKDLVVGARDLTPYERVRWNLLHLNNETFGSPTFIFNLSALTDVRTFVVPDLRPDGTRPPSLVAPVLTCDGELDWERFNLDALFLYLTSTEGFKTAPGGLFDTQVELANSKTPLLDRRPLADSLTAAELGRLWNEPQLREQLQKNGVATVEQLAATPRCELISQRCDNIDAIDLGEIKGHHWSLFIQALRPPPELSDKHAVCDFPRKALMRALLQVTALYNVVAAARRTGSGDA